MLNLNKKNPVIMKKRSNKGYIVVALCTVFATLLSQVGHKEVKSADNTSATALADIVEALSITETTQMDFGNIVPHTSTEDVTLSDAGVITCTNTTCYGTVSQGVFSVTGTDSSTVNVTYTDGILQDSGANTMNLDVDGAGNDSTLVLDGTLNVGGVLSVGASQAEGAYSTANNTDYTVTVSY